MTLLLALSAWASPPPLVGGQPSLGDWPQAAALLWEGELKCSGVLLTSEWVLTAGHCAEDPPDTVVLDSLDLDLDPGERHGVLEAYAHPDYWQTLDLGLLRLNSPSTLSPLPLALDCALADLYDGAPALLLGYGHRQTDAQGPDGQLYELSLPITDADCDDPDRGCRGPLGAELLAGGGGLDSCDGDSGGPLLLRAPGDLHRLLAITSRAAWPSTQPCGDGGVYVRIDYASDWIESILGEALPLPTCEAPEGNSPPYPSAGALRCAEGGVAETQVWPNDPDREDHHWFSVIAPAQHGEVSLSAEGLLRYSPEAGFSGEDAVVVQVHDGAVAAQLTVPATVEAEDRGPVVLTPGCGGGGAALGLLLIPRRRAAGSAG